MQTHLERGVGKPAGLDAAVPQAPLQLDHVAKKKVESQEHVPGGTGPTVSVQVSSLPFCYQHKRPSLSPSAQGVSLVLLDLKAERTETRELLGKEGNSDTSERRSASVGSSCAASSGGHPLSPQRRPASAGFDRTRWYPCWLSGCGLRPGLADELCAEVGVPPPSPQHCIAGAVPCWLGEWCHLTWRPQCHPTLGSDSEALSLQLAHDGSTG